MPILWFVIKNPFLDRPPSVDLDAPQEPPHSRGIGGSSAAMDALAREVRGNEFAIGGLA
jgi:hypothetical protein